MNRLVLFSLLTHSGFIFAEYGVDTAAAIQMRYDNTLQACSNGSPLYECSGVIARGVSVPDAHEYDVWNPSPSSIERNGVSFTFLRKDISRPIVGSDGGFIFYPKLEKPLDKLDIPPLCYFPIDGVTVSREGNGGCGVSLSDPITSAPCQEHGVFTADAWIENSPNGMGQLNRQCGFDLYNAPSDEASKAIYEGILAGNLSSSSINNELVLESWPIDIPAQLPIEAFFYVNGRTDKEKINFVQCDYYNHTGLIVPIIKVTEFNYDGKRLYDFSYNVLDQCIRPTPN